MPRCKVIKLTTRGTHRLAARTNTERSLPLANNAASRPRLFLARRGLENLVWRPEARVRAPHAQETNVWQACGLSAVTLARMTPLLSFTLVSSAVALGGTTPAHRASKLALSHVAQPPLGQIETLKAPLVAAVSLGVVAELFCRKLQVASSAPAYLLTASTFARLVSLQSQARAFLQANGSANGVWLTEQQWCWLMVLANGNGSGATAAISAQHAPFQLSALNWQQQVRLSWVTSREFYVSACLGGARVSLFLSSCRASASLFVSLTLTLGLCLISVTLVELLM